MIDKIDLELINSKISPNIFKGTKNLLIGSNGFLGNWFREWFSFNSIDFVALDIDDSYLGDKSQYVMHDICSDSNLFDVLGNSNFDNIINCAGIASPEKYVMQPFETMDISYVGTKKILDFSRLCGAKNILMFSSSEVYGTPDKDNIPTKETYTGRVPTNGTRSCYDIGKLVLETLCYLDHQKYGTPVNIVRPFNFYGPYMGLKDQRVLSNWMSCYKKEEKIKVYGNGKQTRTFCYVADGISMALAALLLEEKGQFYNIGNRSPELNMQDLAIEFTSALDHKSGYELAIYPDSYPSDEPQRRCPCVEKIFNATGIEAEISLGEGLKRMKTYIDQEVKV